jgi:hypothetical protein
LRKKQGAVPRPIATKRQLSRLQRQRWRERVILSVGIFIIGCIVALLGYGYYVTEIKPLRQTVIRVNEIDFDMSYYLEVFRHYSRGQNPLILNAIADQIVIDIQNYELVRQGASTLGIKVTPEGIGEGLKDRDLPPEKAYRDIVEAELLLEKLREDYFGSQVPRFAPQVMVQAMMLDDEERANEVTERLIGGWDFATLAGELSLDAASKEKKGDLGWLPEGFMSPDFDQAAFNLEIGVVSEPVFDNQTQGYWLIKVLERDDEREISGDIREVWKAKAVDDWVSEQREKSEVESHLDGDKKAWAVDRAQISRG